MSSRVTGTCHNPDAAPTPRGTLTTYCVQVPRFFCVAGRWVRWRAALRPCPFRPVPGKGRPSCVDANPPTAV